ncbi:PREDICTED: sec1 family domain-containing protein 2-like [Acropora digitifera]|uniref:sec1 family domain-containing protein 2-like n=1 Tax=Acropora digitifera TaxID=70779 RepID=UPI00077A3754|nr:PREDICTED: sec1 family domain-containing protein 2-like [Acropora digitifera]
MATKVVATWRVVKAELVWPKFGGNESETKAVFIVGTLLQSETLGLIQSLVQASDFQHCTVLCTVPESVHSFAKRTEVSDASPFGELSQKLREWMGNMYATVDVHYLPLFPAVVCPGLFIAPVFSTFFPLLPSDVPRLQKFLRGIGDKRVFDNLNDFDMPSLPHNLQLKIKMFAFGLNNLFELLEVNEDCYGVGYLSKVIATELANLPAARMRRKSAKSRGSLILIDRTLDLVGPSGHSCDTLADRIIQLLPRLTQHNSDVAVDMSPLCSHGSTTPQTVAPGCLAHTRDPSTQALLCSMITKRQKETMVDLSRQLKEALNKESLLQTSKDVQSKVTVEQLKMMTEHFRGQPKCMKKHSALLQLVRAAIMALTSENISHMDELQALEKGLILHVSEHGPQSSLSQVMKTFQADKQQKFVNIEDILLILIYLYSLTGQECYNSPIEEEQMISMMINSILSGELKCSSESFLGKFDSLKKEFKILFNVPPFVLYCLARARISWVNSEQRLCVMVCQIVDGIFNPESPELPDVEFKSHGLKDFIKTGFSLFMNVSKPRPNNHPLLVLFIVGGITCSEVYQIREALAAYHPNTQLLIGSTRLLKANDLFNQIFLQDNLFPALH